MLQNHLIRLASVQDIYFPQEQVQTIVLPRLVSLKTPISLDPFSVNHLLFL